MGPPPPRLSVVVVELLAVDRDVLAVDAPLRLVVAVLLAAELAHRVAHVDLAHLRDNRLVVPLERGVVSLHVAHPLLEHRDVRLGLRCLAFEVCGLGQRGVERRRHALDDALPLLARVPLRVAHQTARSLHLHRAQYLFPGRRRGLDLGVELLDGLVIGHAALDAPLQPERLPWPARSCPASPRASHALRCRCRRSGGRRR